MSETGVQPGKGGAPVLAPRGRYPLPTDSRQPDQIAGLTGVGRERVRAVAGAGLTALVGSVDARTFGEDALAFLLADLTRIELLGRAHHRVIACMAAEGPVLPLRLASICPDDDTVRGLLRARRPLSR